MKKSKCCGTKVHKQEVGNYFCSHCISICEVQSSFKPFFLLFTGVIMFLSINCYAPNNTCKKEYPKPFIDTCDIQLNDSSILKELNRVGCYFPEVAIRQIHQECGININSKIARENMNIFGLKCSCKYTHGVKNGHSNYKTYKDNIQCYVNFTNKYWKKYCKNYAEDELYLNKLTKMK